MLEQVFEHLRIKGMKMIAGMDSAALNDSDPLARPRTISVLVATKRPEMLAFWPQLLAAQDYPDFEVIAAFHGEAFTADHEAAARAWLGERLTVVRVPGECRLGEVLNRATAAAAGELIVKWDDDDLYSSRHLSDLAEVHRESGATVVGKTLEYCYLASSNRTIRLGMASAVHRTMTGDPLLPPGACQMPDPIVQMNVYAGSIAGNTICVSREDLQQLGDWQEVPFAADTCLLQEVLKQGGQLHSASGAGHLVLRTASGSHRHTWNIADTDLQKFSIDERPGADAGFAQVDVPDALLQRWAGSRPAAV